jgi:hypothetical protein
MNVLHQGENGQLCQLKWSEYRGEKGLNPSSIADGLIGENEVDVRAIHNAMTGLRKEPSAASQDRMDRGSLVHMALLQPERLATDVKIWNGAKRAGAEWEAFNADVKPGQLLMRQKDFDHAMSIANTLKNHHYVGNFLNGCEAEVAMFCRDGGISCRGQVDAVDLKNKRIIDVKTTDAGIGPDTVNRTIRSLHYREKMALYRRWIAHITGTYTSEWRCWNLFLCMDQDSPGIRRVLITSDALEWGEIRMVNAISKYAAAVKAGEFPVYAVDDFADVKPWEIQGQELEGFEDG